MPIEGSLKELSLPNIIQVNCTEMNTAAVSLRHEDKEGVICFAGGAVVHAVMGNLVGEEAVYDLLTWPDGTFVVEADVIPPERTVTTNWNMLLLEGIRRMDEKQGEMEWSAIDAGGDASASSAADDLTALAQEFRTIAGVEGAVIISRDGVVLGADVDGEAEKEGAVAVFVGNAAGQIGDGFNLSPFDWGLVTMGDDRVLILEGSAFFVGLLLGERASPALVSADAGKLLR